MSIASLVTRGYSNGSFIGSIAEIVTMGYSVGEDTAIWTDKPAVDTEWGDKIEVSTIWTDK